MGLKAGTPMRDIEVDTVFIGSCTNSRIEDLRAAAEVARGRKVKPGVRTLVVPGSVAVKAQAEAEGLDQVFIAAGFDWREPGCSMCLAMNPDKLAPGERCASTSNRNFEGRQGKGGRTHLVSPAVAAATAIAGHFATPEDLAWNPVRVITGTGVPLVRTDVDTDQIIPSDWLKRVERTGFGAGLFSEWRENSDFVLNQERHDGAKILVAGSNFGTGSSREHAVWALMDYGFEAVLSPRFADIFRNNSGKQGLVAATVDNEVVHRLWEAIDEDPELEIVVDVEHKRVAAPSIGLDAPFELDDFTQYRLVNGLDDIGLTLRHADAIDAHEHRGRATSPAYRPLLRRSRRDGTADRAGERQRRRREQELVDTVGRAVVGQRVEVPELPLHQPLVAQVEHVHGQHRARILARPDLEREGVGRDRRDLVSRGTTRSRRRRCPACCPRRLLVAGRQQPHVAGAHEHDVAGSIGTPALWRPPRGRRHRSRIRARARRRRATRAMSSSTPRSRPARSARYRASPRRVRRWRRRRCRCTATVVADV